MTLLDMVNKEDICTALNTLCNNKPTIPQVLDDYLSVIASNGRTEISWNLVKPLIIFKLNKVLDEWLTVFPLDNIPKHFNGPDQSFDDLRALLVTHLHRFNNAPFTIQRICELLVDPKRHYSRPDKFLRAIQKVLLVVGAVDPQGNGVFRVESLDREQSSLLNHSIASTDQEGGSPLPDVEESFDITPILENNDNSDMSISNDCSGRHWMGPTLASAGRPFPLGFQSPATAKCLKLQAERLSAAANTNEVDMDTSAPLEDFDEYHNPSMLRPIGQLEAIVQNLAQANSEKQTQLMPEFLGTESPKTPTRVANPLAVRNLSSCNDDEEEESDEDEEGTPPNNLLAANRKRESTAAPFDVNNGFGVVQPSPSKMPRIDSPGSNQPQDEEDEPMASNGNHDEHEKEEATKADCEEEQQEAMVQSESATVESEQTSIDEADQQTPDQTETE